VTDSLLDTAVKAALAGGEEIMRVYAEPFEVRHKEDKTPVTEADLASERVIEQILREAFPDIPVVSEETADPAAWVPSGPRFWCVDPLDGTREFVNRTDEFAVNIGLVEDGKAVLGVVYGPATGVIYTANGPGTAAQRHGHGSGPIEPITARAPAADGIVVVHSRSHENSRRLAEYFEGKPVAILERRKCGSALKFGVLAAGEADFYPRFGTTMEWDTAAGQAILEAAGGYVVTLHGIPLVYGKPGLKNDGFLAWGRKPAW
jgi:3'(2'), 5'-bisphosphate nucleotidase